MDGISMVNEIRRFEESKRLTGCKVITVSGNDLSDAGKELMKSNSKSNCFLRKPLYYEELVREVLKFSLDDNINDFD